MQEVAAISMLDANPLSLARLLLVSAPRYAARLHRQIIADRPHDLINVLKLEADDAGTLQ